LFLTGDLDPTCQPVHIAELAKQEMVMALEVRFLSAFVRKSDISMHYPGGCPAFEQEQLLGRADSALYSLIAMSAADLEAAVSNVARSGFDVNRFVAVADMWQGPIQSVQGVAFKSRSGAFPPVWFATARKEPS
jgi:hypothetical protein